MTCSLATRKLIKGAAHRRSRTRWPAGDQHVFFAICSILKSRRHVFCRKIAIYSVGSKGAASQIANEMAGRRPTCFFAVCSILKITPACLSSQNCDLFCLASFFAREKADFEWLSECRSIHKSILFRSGSHRLHVQLHNVAIDEKYWLGLNSSGVNNETRKSSNCDGSVRLGILPSLSGSRNHRGTEKPSQLRRACRIVSHIEPILDLYEESSRHCPLLGISVPGSLADWTKI